MGRLTSPLRAAADAARTRGRDITLLGCVAANSVGAGLAWLPLGFIAAGVQGLTLLWLELKGKARGAR